MSTRGQAPPLDFAGVLLAGLANDGGLYVPDTWPQVTEAEIAGFENRAYADVATELMARFTEPALSAAELAPLVDDAYRGFDHSAVAPLRQLSLNEWVLELFHGPTLSFKDYALQVVGRLFDHVLRRDGLHMTVVGATSGDTGSAAIEAVRGRESITAFILHPKGRVTDVQRRQMTTVLASNIHNIAIEGTFDDCQALVKQMFSDVNFRDSLRLTAVNSINWARVAAQTVYYFTTAAFLGTRDRTPSFSVPTGNFGDIFAGYVAKKMGLPINKLIVATNENDILHRAISKGDYISKEVKETSSPSMDIQLASNFERLIYYVNNSDSKITADIMKKIKQNTYQIDKSSLEIIQKDFLSESCNEKETLDIIKKTYQENNMILDPHTAVGVGAAKKLSFNDCVVLSTAHPCKFPDAINNAINKDEKLPEELQHVLDKDENFKVLNNNTEDVKNFVKSNTK